MSLKETGRSDHRFSKKVKKNHHIIWTALVFIENKQNTEEITSYYKTATWEAV